MRSGTAKLLAHVLDRSQVLLLRGLELLVELFQLSAERSAPVPRPES
jgi:hypothetical protein